MSLLFPNRCIYGIILDSTCNFRTFYSWLFCDKPDSLDSMAYESHRKESSCASQKKVSGGMEVPVYESKKLLQVNVRPRFHAQVEEYLPAQIYFHE